MSGLRLTPLTWSGYPFRRATAAGRYVLLNGNQASNPFTPEPLEADCHEFIETVAVLLATLGAPVLEPVKLGPPQSFGQTAAAGAGEAEKLYFKETGGARRRATRRSEGLLVLAGSIGRPSLVPSAPPSIGTQRDTLQADGVITIKKARSWCFSRITSSAVPRQPGAC